jgi:hypothetical protein
MWQTSDITMMEELGSTTLSIGLEPWMFAITDLIEWDSLAATKV